MSMDDTETTHIFARAIRSASLSVVVQDSWNFGVSKLHVTDLDTKNVYEVSVVKIEDGEKEDDDDGE